MPRLLGVSYGRSYMNDRTSPRLAGAGYPCMILVLVANTEDHDQSILTSRLPAGCGGNRRQRGLGDAHIGFIGCFHWDGGHEGSRADQSWSALPGQNGAV